jgi:hypothetical protein
MNQPLSWIWVAQVMVLIAAGTAGLLALTWVTLRGRPTWHHVVTHEVNKGWEEIKAEIEARERDKGLKARWVSRPGGSQGPVGLPRDARPPERRSRRRPFAFVMIQPQRQAGVDGGHAPPASVTSNTPGPERRPRPMPRKAAGVRPLGGIALARGRLPDRAGGGLPGAHAGDAEAPDGSGYTTALTGTAGNHQHPHGPWAPAQADWSRLWAD